MAVLKPLFNFNGQQLRHTMIQGEPWFVAADVCRILNIHITRGGREVAVGNAIRKLDKSEVTLHPMAGANSPQLKPTNMVSESGLYKLIMRSDKAEAVAFQNWVTDTPFR